MEVFGKCLYLYVEEGRSGFYQEECVLILEALEVCGKLNIAVSIAREYFQNRIDSKLLNLGDCAKNN